MAEKQRKGERGSVGASRSDPKHGSVGAGRSDQKQKPKAGWSPATDAEHPEPIARPARSETGGDGDSGDRIAKVIARAGLCSRRDAEKMVLEGRVTVDGVVIASPALNVTDANLIVVDGKPLKAPEAARMWRYHKPSGLVTTHKDEKGRPVYRLDELSEAAQIDGATWWQTQRHITIPLLGPTIRIWAFLSIIGSLQLFDMVWVTTGGGPAGATATMATYMVQFGFQRNQLGFGSAVAVILFVISLAFALVYQRFVLRRDIDGALTSGVR